MSGRLKQTLWEWGLEFKGPTLKAPRVLLRMSASLPEEMLSLFTDPTEVPSPGCLPCTAPLSHLEPLNFS